jgi:serine/threonine-protein kinase RsbW
VEQNASIVTLVIPSQIGFEKIAMSLVQYLAADMGLSQEKVEGLKTALAEACINAMEHGNRFNFNLDIEIKFIQHPCKLEIIVKDLGIGGRISLSNEEPDIYAKISGEKSKRGWGIFLIKNLVDEVEIDTLSKQENIVRMVSYLESNECSNVD